LYFFILWHFSASFFPDTFIWFLSFLIFHHHHKKIDQSSGWKLYLWSRHVANVYHIVSAALLSVIASNTSSLIRFFVN
jgi:hypothetical protein